MQQDGLAGGSAVPAYSLDFDGSVLLVDPIVDRLHVLNDAAALVWEVLATGGAPDDAARTLAETYGLSDERASADVAAIVAEWRAGGVLKSGAPPVPAASSEAQSADGPASSRVYRFGTSPVRARYRPAALEDVVGGLLAPVLSTGSEPVPSTIDVGWSDGVMSVARDGVPAGRSADLDEALGSLVVALIEASYPEAHWIAWMHAASVGDGRAAVAIAGESGSGKSTLTAALLADGLAYLSDDIAPLDGRTGRVMPVPFALRLKEPGWPALDGLVPRLQEMPLIEVDGLRQRLLDPVRAGLRVEREALPLRALVFVRYAAGEAARLRRIRPIEACTRLTAAQCWISLAEPDLRAFLGLLAETPSFVLSYGRLSEGVAEVRSILETV